MHAIDPTRDPLVLLIGDVGHEGIRSSLSQCGREYKQKLLHSKPDNWDSICDYFEDYKVTLVLAKLTGQTFRLLHDAEYQDVTRLLLTKLASVPHAVFLHSSLSDPELAQFDEENEFTDVFTPISEPLRVGVLKRLADANIEIFSYTKNAEVTVLAQEIISRTERGLLFRVYVPNAQLWSNETDRLLQLFRDYLIRVANADVRLDQTRTKVGVIYELYGSATQEVAPLQEHFEDFSQFLNLCVTSPETAEALLRQHDISDADVIHILSRYAKEARRIQVDLKHDREQKVLLVRQRLESELIECIHGELNSEAIESLIDLAVPRVLKHRVPAIVSRAASSFVDHSSNPVTINFNPQFVQTVNAVVAQEISGDISLNESDHELLRLFAEYAGEQHSQLVSALRELKDDSVPEPARMTAKQRILSFLRVAGTKTADVTVDILKSYIAKTMFGL